jgi:endonuclease/exonuclease/phosphatase family metal-dependent hydrolase
MRVRSCVLAAVCAVFSIAAVSASAQEVVLHSSDITTIRGNWARVSSTSGAGGQLMSSEDRGWSNPNAPLSGPSDYFEASFTAEAYTPYRIWLRIRAKNNSKWNESVWVQFNDSLNSSGNAAYRIGTTSAILMNLEECSGCGVSSWGWTGGSYWTGMNQQVQFPSAGTKTIRIQTREDGADIDQIVLSPSRYLTTRPGAATNDTTILPRSGGSSSGSSTNTAKALPGLIQAQDFDTGANGTAYYDRTSGNNGGQYRATDVDIERTNDSSGTYNVGWIDAGEWLNYTVGVASAGSYTIELRVASPNGSSAHVRFGGTNVTGTMSIPSTGGWQSWTTVRKTVTLSAGTQVMRVVFDASGANFNWIRVIENTSSTSGESGSGPFGGTAWAIPGTIQSEDFDLGGQNVGYYDNSPGNTGGAYRSTDVDIQSSSVGYNVGWVGAGEWLSYTVNVASAGTYTLTARVASNGSGGTFYVEFGGSNKTGTMTVPNTGGWQSYRDVNATVSLSAGTQVMRVRMAGNGGTGAVGNFDYIRLASGGSTTTTTSTRLRVMTWNVHFGKDINGTLNLESQARVMADSGADVILLQEASTWDGDQPNRFPQLLQQYTGHTWYRVWSSHSGTGSGEGTLILTRLPIVSSSIANFHSRGFGRLMVSVNGVNINLFNGHLAWSPTSARTAQLLDWLAWMRNFGGPKIAGGDFNAWWGEYWITETEKEFSDTWKDVTGSNQNGYTLPNPSPNVRFDYLFRAFISNTRLTPTACWVISTNTSDHRPVVADYSVQ